MQIEKRECVFVKKSGLKSVEENCRSKKQEFWGEMEEKGQNREN